MGSSKFKNVYRFKITLKGIRPPIWRRIEVPENFTFYQFHRAIQSAMGWLDYHAHAFRFKQPGFRWPLEIADAEILPDQLDENKEVISRHFNMETRRAEYVYDWGDTWKHTIELEKILPAEEGVAYPRCVKGRRACPPEDCGGVFGYFRLLDILSDPSHPEHETMKEWVGEEYDPNQFDPDAVVFDRVYRLE